MLKVKLKFKPPHYIVSGNMVICQLEYSITPYIFSFGICHGLNNDMIITT